MGMTLREVIFEVGGGLRDDAEFKAVQIGGPSGACLTRDDLDIPLDFDSLKKAGAIIGSARQRAFMRSALVPASGLSCAPR